MKFEKHPDDTMGLVWKESENPLHPGETLYSFPLADDEISAAYLAWIQTVEP